MGGASARHGDVEPDKKAALGSQPDPSQGDGRRVTKQQQVSDTVRRERVSIEGDGTDDVTGGSRAGTLTGSHTN